jgi:hypothetical protein
VTGSALERLPGVAGFRWATGVLHAQGDGRPVGRAAVACGDVR